MYKLYSVNNFKCHISKELEPETCNCMSMTTLHSVSLWLLKSNAISIIIDIEGIAVSSVKENYSVCSFYAKAADAAA